MVNDMGRKGKLYLKDGFEPSKIISAVENADDTDLAILGVAVLTAKDDGLIDSEFIEALGRFETAELTASLKFWKGAGIFVTKQSSQKETVKTAHKDGVLTHTSVEAYTNDELANVLESRVSAEFVDEAQRILGKIFNNNEISKLVGIVDQLGFEEEAVLAILSYCVRLDKKSVSYAEKIAVSFHDEDILNSEAVHAQIDYLERRNDALEKIRALYGFGGRALTTTEKKYFTLWTEEYGFDFEIVKKAYELTVDTIQSPVPKYTDTILKKWYDKDLKTEAEIDAFIAEEKASAPKRQRMSSVRQAVPSVVASSPEKRKEIDEWFMGKIDERYGK